MDRASLQERFGIQGSSQAIQNVIDRARQVARTDITVLIEGESGVGKELIAHLIHEISPRKHGPLIIVNCGAIPEGLIESELFGAEKGAYTGAVERRTGYFEEGDGGTIFLDEIGEMPLAAQVRLLRVLETGQFSRVGSSTTRTTDARIVAATNKDLAREMQAGRFREDLYYRLSTVVIRIPPLRERREDILPIFETYLHRFAQRYNSAGKRLDDEAKRLLRQYNWPGNVRELRNVAEQVVVLLREETVGAEALRPLLRGVGPAAGSLVPVAAVRDDHAGDANTRERELIYRALLELRMEMRELKEQVGRLRPGVAVPREVAERGGLASGGQRGFVILRDASGHDDYASLVEDVPYEIASDEAMFAPPTSASAPNGSDEPDGDEDLEAGEAPLPTLEDAERQLITEALRRFDSNRRQTAKALGISERTLYRKIKELDEDL